MNKAVLSWRLKMGSDGADVTCNGREFQVHAVATWNARSPTVGATVGPGTDWVFNRSWVQMSKSQKQEAH